MRQNIENLRSIRLNRRALAPIKLIAVMLACSCGSAVPGKHGEADAPSGAGGGGAADAFVPLPTVFDVVFSSLPDTLYFAQVVPVTATVTVAPAVHVNCSTVAYSSQLAVDEKATTCTDVMTAGMPCVFAFTFTALIPQLGDEQVETTVYDGIYCSSNLGAKSQYYTVRLAYGWDPVDDAGTTYCGSVADGLTDAGAPSISITSVPPMGEAGFAAGQVSGAAPYCSSVAVYIYVLGGWWTKPYWAWPYTTIQVDGTWSAQIDTDGSDQDATEVRAYLVPRNYRIPLARGEASLSGELDAFPHAAVFR